MISNTRQETLGAPVTTHGITREGGTRVAGMIGEIHGMIRRETVRMRENLKGGIMIGGTSGTRDSAESLGVARREYPTRKVNATINSWMDQKLLKPRR